MKQLIVAALTVGLVSTLSFALASHSSAASHGPFVGGWKATDTFDGSSMLLTIGGGPGSSRRIILLDHDATLACPDGGPAMASDRGAVSGNLLQGDWTVRCLVDRSSSFSGSFEFVYDASTDTLSDGAVLGFPPIIWHRAGAP